MGTLLKCPRCKTEELPAADVARCPAKCGAWVSAFAANEVLTERDRRRDPVTRWWRMREPCPACTEKMVLFGDDPGLFQGCELHGYFIDEDAIPHTGLARGIDDAALERRRSDPAHLEAERQRLLRGRQEQAERELAVERQRAADAMRSAALERAQAVDDRIARVQAMFATETRSAVASYIVSLEDRIEALELRLAARE
jgi:hypothetical protein